MPTPFSINLHLSAEDKARIKAAFITGDIPESAKPQIVDSIQKKFRDLLRKEKVFKEISMTGLRAQSLYNKDPVVVLDDKDPNALYFSVCHSYYCTRPRDLLRFNFSIYYDPAEVVAQHISSVAPQAPPTELEYLLAHLPKKCIKGVEKPSCPSPAQSFEEIEKQVASFLALKNKKSLKKDKTQVLDIPFAGWRVDSDALRKGHRYRIIAVGKARVFSKVMGDAAGGFDEEGHQVEKCPSSNRDPVPIGLMIDDRTVFTNGQHDQSTSYGMELLGSGQRIRLSFSYCGTDSDQHGFLKVFIEDLGEI